MGERKKQRKKEAKKERKEETKKETSKKRNIKGIYDTYFLSLWTIQNTCLLDLICQVEEGHSQIQEVSLSAAILL